VYLRFTDDKIMNDTVRKQVQVSGQLKSVKMEKGHFITELTVITVRSLILQKQKVIMSYTAWNGADKEIQAFS
jgi:hypothetical protein